MSTRQIPVGDKRRNIVHSTFHARRHLGSCPCHPSTHFSSSFQAQRSGRWSQASSWQGGRSRCERSLESVLTHPGASSGSGDHSWRPGPVSPVSWAQSQGPVHKQSGDGLGAQAVPGVEQGAKAQARERRSQQVAVLGEPQAGAPGHEAPFLPHAWAPGMTGPQECRVPEASSCWCPAGIHLGTAGPQAEMVAGTLGWGAACQEAFTPH